jgi:hypothetical protein
VFADPNPRGYGFAMGRGVGRIAVVLGLALASTGCRGVLGIEDTQLVDNCSLVTQRVFFADKPVEDTTLKIGTLSQARFEALAAELGTTLDPNRGHALAKVVDCDDEATEFAAGDFEPSNPGATSFVVSGNQLQKGTDTTVDGFFGALNLDARAELVTTAYPDELSVPSSQGDVVTRAGELGYILLEPNSEVVAPPQTLSEWECVGQKPDPVVDDPEITLTIDLQSSSAFVPNGVPVVGARVAVCLEEAAACDPSAPVAEGAEAFTDGTGRAQLVVSTGDEGFDGSLIITGTAPNCGGSESDP